MPALLDSVSDLSNRISVLDAQLSESSLIKLASAPADDKIETTPVVVVEGAPVASIDGAWESEWIALRAEELMLTKQHRGQDEAAIRKCDNKEAWVQRNMKHVAWQRGAGWTQEQAESYTCVALGGQTAISHALRQGTGKFSKATELLCTVLSQRALWTTTPSPPTYRHLSGVYSLLATDPSWSVLLDKASPGLSFRTSALVIASDDSQCIDSKGYRVRLSKSSGKHFYEAQDSDVVCFQGLPRDARTARSLVQTGAVSWHLPPLATVTLEKVLEPGDWSAYGKAVARRLFVVRVAFEC